MNPETKSEDKKRNNMQDTATTPECELSEYGDQSNDSTTFTTAGSDDATVNELKAYVDPGIAAESQISEIKAQLSDQRDKYIRAVAENENLRKRTEREKSDIAKYAVTKFASDMLAIADNLRRAITAASETSDPEEQSGPLKALLDGVQLTDQELQKSLEKHGIHPIAAKDQIFDPYKHQAVVEQDDTTVPAGTILEVLQDGYQIEDRVLRPSMVIVAKGGIKISKSDRFELTGKTFSDQDSMATTAKEKQEINLENNEIKEDKTAY